MTALAPARPVRVQLSRKKGWKMPPNTVKVDRATQWGNPFKPGVCGILTREHAVMAFRGVARTGQWSARVASRGTFQVTIDDVRRELRGKNLACWCPLDQPCHADVLLELANL